MKDPAGSRLTPFVIDSGNSPVWPVTTADAVTGVVWSLPAVAVLVRVPALATRL